MWWCFIVLLVEMFKFWFSPAWFGVVNVLFTDSRILQLLMIDIQSSFIYNLHKVYWPGHLLECSWCFSFSFLWWNYELCYCSFFLVWLNLNEDVSFQVLLFSLLCSHKLFWIDCWYFEKWQTWLSLNIIFLVQIPVLKDVIDNFSCLVGGEGV